MRKIHSTAVGANTVTVHYNRDDEEYVAKVYVDGIHMKGANYHTEDKDDAIATANHIAANYKRRHASQLKQ